MRRALSAHRVFRALGHPLRVRIVRELGEGAEKSVGELVGVCGGGWSTVSRHLAVLREAGILAERKSGLRVFYRLAAPCVARFVDCLEHPHRYPSLHADTGRAP